MTIAYFDCFNGAGGDMIVASLIHAGANADALRDRLAALGLNGYALSIDPVSRGGIAATQFNVKLDAKAKQPHRHLKHVVEIIDGSKLPAGVREKATRIFERLAEAEARVHGTTIEKVHFHEVGAVDAVIDIVGAVLALDLLGIEDVICSPIPVGSGTVKCDHGIMPVPAPATAELLKGVPIADTTETGELVTPTAASVLTTLASGFGPMPTMTIGSIGYGAGTREGDTRPNLLRVLIGELASAGQGCGLPPGGAGPEPAYGVSPRPQPAEPACVRRVGLTGGGGSLSYRRCQLRAVQGGQELQGGGG